MTGLLQMRELKTLLEDINTEKVLVVWEGQEETNVSVFVALTLLLWLGISYTQLCKAPSSGGARGGAHMFLHLD